MPPPAALVEERVDTHRVFPVNSKAGTALRATKLRIRLAEGSRNAETSSEVHLNRGVMIRPSLFQLMRQFLYGLAPLRAPDQKSCRGRTNSANQPK